MKHMYGKTRKFETLLKEMANVSTTGKIVIFVNSPWTVFKKLKKGRSMEKCKRRWHLQASVFSWNTKLQNALSL